MCGFVGAIGPGAARLTMNLLDALAAIGHRGPDAEGTFFAPQDWCILGHRRLAILDLSKEANQPMYGPEGVLVYNGEIYNHLSLRASNNPTGQSFSTHCDSESLLRGLSGVESRQFLEESVGMYAGAYYVPDQRKLLLFRDALGIKPLYYSLLSDSTLVFGSEIKALIALIGEKNHSANLEVVSAYMSYENFPEEATLFENIKLLAPGRCLKFEEGNGKLVQTGDFSIKRKSKLSQISKEDSSLQGETLRRIDESVQLHLLSDVPLGVYLSGGIDSSTVAALAAKHTSSLLGFTGYFKVEDPFYDEREVSRAVARHIGIDLVEVPIVPQDLEENFDRVVYTLDEPRMGMGSFSQFMVAQEASKHRKVILAGHGGDELFGGYPAFKAFWFLQNRGVSKELFSFLKSLSGKELPWVANVLFQWFRTARLQFAPKLFPSERIPRFSEELEKPFSHRPMDDPVKDLMNYYRNTYLPGLLVVEDKISMAHSLETRVPLWSQPLVEWAANIPVERLIPCGRLKGMMKNAVRPLLPASVFSAPKRGFPTPLRIWFRKDLRNFIYKRLVQSESPVHAVVDRNWVRNLISSHEKVKLPYALDERRAHRIWILLCLDSWMRQFNVEVPASA